MKPRYRKVIRDLLSNKSRTLLVVLAIAVGVFAFGGVFITQDVLLKNINDEYKKNNPSTITLFLSEFDAPLLTWIKSQPGVKESGGKATQSVKLVRSEKDEMLNISSVPDFRNLILNKLLPLKGSWPPKKGELILERNSFNGNKVTLGETVTIKTALDQKFNLTLTGMVYDNSAIPYIFTNQMTGFVSWDTLAIMGLPKRYNQLDIATDESIKTLSDAEKLTSSLSEKLKDKGLVVNNTMVFTPNEHWAADNSKAFTTILSVIGVFSLILSGFLVVNTISALLAQQKKQIGIMKAVGAKRSQITIIYLLMVGIYGLLALFIALPVGMLLGYVFLKLVTDFLNMDVNSFYLPPKVFLMEVVASLIVPVIAALIPIIQGTKKSVREVLSDFETRSKAGRLDMLLMKISGLDRPLIMSFRNTFRKKGRLILTLGTLTTAGALFISVINVRTGMFKEMDRILAMYDFGVSINLAGDYSTDSIIDRLMDVDYVTAVEARTHVAVKRIKSDGTKGTEFRITGLPPETPFSHPVILSGRWITPDDNNMIVVSSGFVRDNPDIKPGDNLLLDVGNEKIKLEVVGIIVMSGSEKIAFSDFKTVSRIKDKPNLASGYLLKTSPDTTTIQNQVATSVEDKLKSAGVNVAAKQTKNEIYASAANQFNFLIFFLLAMAVMVAIVGGLGLAGTMSLNVLERTREIGIMRSIGAGDGVIKKMVLFEGLIMGLLSFMLAIPLSFPLTYGFCFALGNAFFERTLVFTIVPLGILIWLLIILTIAVVASLIPAGNASKMTISETLSYE